MSRAATIWGYVVLALAVVAYQVAGLVLGRTATLGQVLRRVIRVPAGRFVLLAGWLWVGWHTFVRWS
jgi:hypothetical protein